MEYYIFFYNEKKELFLNSDIIDKNIWRCELQEKDNFIKNIVNIGNNKKELKEYLDSFSPDDIKKLSTDSESGVMGKTIIEHLYELKESSAISLLEKYGFDINQKFLIKEGNLLLNSFKYVHVDFIKEILNCDNIKWDYFGDNIKEKDILEVALERGLHDMFKLALRVMNKYKLPFLENNQYVELAVKTNSLLSLKCLLNKGFEMKTDLIDVKLKEINQKITFFSNFENMKDLSSKDKKMIIFLRRKGFLFENNLTAYKLNDSTKEWISSLGALINKKELNKVLEPIENNHKNKRRL